MAKMDNASNVLMKVVRAILKNQNVCKYLSHPTNMNPLSEADITNPIDSLYKTNKIQPDIFLGMPVTEKGIYIRVFFNKFKFDGTTENGEIAVHVIYSKDVNVTMSDYNGEYKNKPLDVCREIIATIDTKDLGNGVGLGLSIKTDVVEHLGYDNDHACYQMVFEKLESNRGR